MPERSAEEEGEMGKPFDAAGVLHVWPSLFWGSAREGGYLDASSPPSDAGADRPLRRGEDS